MAIGPPMTMTCLMPRLAMAAVAWEDSDACWLNRIGHWPRSDIALAAMASGPLCPVARTAVGVGAELAGASVPLEPAVVL